ncbi:uncharacterized protein BX663DRAFT_519467 [Cokeromyces recurvatus]|uniref:uncharacterized protein n=1 Tax=Cokeromyces recurvatus TaxID=90255 RepID=UPI00221F7A0D|nr:uncharacterized protein BX663DRAFT_519467 [Cokeromyces recurvatus]KAI7900054.1 hypothetical protein BX663DRAFT_519467 [Cokeromyces recurvatus]
MKQILYDDSKNVKEMKIALRFMVNLNGKDKDTVCMEIANATLSIMKIHKDNDRLLIESKDVLDSLIYNTLNIQSINDISGIALHVVVLDQ